MAVPKRVFLKIREVAQDKTVGKLAVEKRSEAARPQPPSTRPMHKPYPRKLALLPLIPRAHLQEHSSVPPPSVDEEVCLPYELEEKPKTGSFARKVRLMKGGGEGKSAVSSARRLSLSMERVSPTVPSPQISQSPVSSLRTRKLQMISRKFTLSKEALSKPRLASSEPLPTNPALPPEPPHQQWLSSLSQITAVAETKPLRTRKRLLVRPI